MALTPGTGLEQLSIVINSVLDYTVWAIVAGYVYFGWKLIFGPGGSGSTWGQGARDWIKEKAGDALDWHAERKEAGRKIAAAEQMAMLEYDDLEKLKREVSKVTQEESNRRFFGGATFSKLARAGKAAKRHEAKANARLVSLRDSLNGDDFKELFKQKLDLKAKIDDQLKKMGTFNNTVIREIKKFDSDLGNKTRYDDVFDKKNALIGYLDEAIKAERGLAATFKAIKDILAHELKKEPYLAWYGSKP